MVFLRLYIIDCSQISKLLINNSAKVELVVASHCRDFAGTGWYWPWDFGCLYLCIFKIQETSMRSRQNHDIDKAWIKEGLISGSVYSVVAVAVERFCNICKPFKRNLVRDVNHSFPFPSPFWKILNICVNYSIINY